VYLNTRNNRLFLALMNTRRNEKGEKGSDATCVHDTTSGCSLFLFPFDVMVGLTYREELAKIPGCDSISTLSKEHQELLQKSGWLSVFSHKQISFHTTSSVGQHHNLALLLSILKKLLSVPPEIYDLHTCILCTAGLRFRLCG